jgi:hypothetical protein
MAGLTGSLLKPLCIDKACGLLTNPTIKLLRIDEDNLLKNVA